MLISREVIFTEDVEKIFGKRPWVSRTDEILAAREEQDKNKSDRHPEAEDVEAEDITPTDDTPTGDSDDKPIPTPPPYRKS